MIDFIRRNFADFDVSLRMWHSSEKLYYNLDRDRAGAQSWDKSALSYLDFIVKAHELPFDESLQRSIDAFSQGQTRVTFTPVRPLVRSLASYAAYTGADFTNHALSDIPDPYYKRGLSVEQALITFYEDALQTSTLVDVESGLKDPDTLATELGLKLNKAPRSLQKRLPPKRHSHGLLGEVSSRLRGRPASEVIVPNPNPGKRREIALTPRLQRLDQALQSRLSGRLVAAPDVVHGQTV